MKHISVFIEGMHCPACTALLTEEFSKVDGVHHADVSLRSGSAEIYYDSAEPDIKELLQRAAQYGYTARLRSDTGAAVASPLKKGARLRSWALGAGTAALFVGLFLLLEQSGLIQGLSPRAGLGQFGLALFTGIVASVSSCFAAVGSLVIAFGGLYGGTSTDKPLLRAVRAHSLFHIGRLASFFGLGGLLGLIGGGLALSGRTLAVVMIVYALVMVVMGLSILGLGRLINLAGLKPPAFASRWMTRLKKSSHPLAPLVLGAVTFFLPCGFTQSMQVLALGAGGFLNGALLMLVFALGTTPVLFAAGIGSSWTRFKGVDFLRKAAGLLVIIFAVYTFVAAGNLFDFKGNVLAAGERTSLDTIEPPSPADASENAVIPAAPTPGREKAIPPSPSPLAVEPKTDTITPPDNPIKTPAAQRVEMHVTYRGYEPSVLKVKAGIPVRWVIYGDQVTGCTNRIIVPSLQINQALRNGENIVSFTPNKAGRIPFSCWMGTVRGVFLAE